MVFLLFTEEECAHRHQETSTIFDKQANIGDVSLRPRRGALPPSQYITESR